MRKNKSKTSLLSCNQHNKSDVFVLCFSIKDPICLKHVKCFCTNKQFFTKHFVRTGYPKYLGGEKNRMLVYSQKGPNMGGESCTVLRLRFMRNLAMSLNPSWTGVPELRQGLGGGADLPYHQKIPK